MQEKSKNGVLLNKDFRDSLIIDKYDIEILNWRGRKLDQLRSENSEDAMTWNVFRSLKQINPSDWLPYLFKQSFHQDFPYSLETIDIILWKKLNPPVNLPIREGQSEVDVIIESDEFVWFIEAKYKSDISLGTTHDKTRNQIIRNIDVGLDYKNGKDFYFSLLILDEEHSPKGYHYINVCSYSLDHIMNDIPHRRDGLINLKGVGLLTWLDLLNVLGVSKRGTEIEFQRVVATQAEQWLSKKIVKSTERKNDAIFDRTRQYRYSLSRAWNPNKGKVVFICLNPSTADGVSDDPTLKRCIDFAKRWHNGKYGSLEMVNLFSYRATDFDMLREVENPIGPENDDFIVKAVRSASLVVVAWGEKGIYRNRHKEVLRLLSNEMIEVHCLEILKCNQPKHPLFARKELTPRIFVQ
ncbi:DUF1643 domain-containing protein [Neobacillus niacini]|uniref:DUF1643 domain-containing protein n=1 Tax=Neobacillus niacini TaxID=86668 RepID=UPI00300293DB